MYKLYLLIGLIFSTLYAHADEGDKKQKATMRYYINASAEYQLNNGDVTNSGLGSNSMTTTNQTGAGLAIEFYRKDRHNIFMSAMLSFSYIPNRLVVNYSPTDAGFATSTGDKQYALNFNNYNVSPTIKIGYAIPLSNANTLDIGFGAILLFQINGQEDDELKMISLSNDGYKDAAVATHTKWGNYRKSFMYKALVTTHVAYHTNIANKEFQIGVHYSVQPKGIINSAVSNNVTVNYLGTNRSDAGFSTHYDKLQSISLFLGVGL